MSLLTDSKARLKTAGSPYFDAVKSIKNDILGTFGLGGDSVDAKGVDGTRQGHDSIKSIGDTAKILMDEGKVTEFMDRMSQNFGAGPFYNQLQTFFRETDKFQHNSLPPNALHAGYTFITRPKLCFHDLSLNKQTEFLPMITEHYNSVPFAIRCLLDTKFGSTQEAKLCKLVNPNNPFITPLGNGLTGISGYPAVSIETVTTETGFHSEDQTFATGYNQMNKTYDLSLDFRDPQHGPIMAIFFYWILYIGYLTKGMMPAYMEDIVQRRLNYTCSIYRFVVDPSKRRIIHYSKATGCFPKSMPLGALFNYSDTERFVRAAGNFNIDFVANRIDYNKPEILAEFNYLVRKFDSGIVDRIDVASLPLTRSVPEYDSRGNVKLDEDGNVKRKDVVYTKRGFRAADNYYGIPYVSTGGLFGKGDASPITLEFR